MTHDFCLILSFSRAVRTQYLRLFRRIIRAIGVLPIKETEQDQSTVSYRLGGARRMPGEEKDPTGHSRRKGTNEE
jgi:hypothetical protein